MIGSGLLGRARPAADNADFELVRRSGLREYFDPFTGAGYGSERFAWTAALVIDVIERRRA